MRCLKLYLTIGIINMPFEFKLEPIFIGEDNECVFETRLIMKDNVLVWFVFVVVIFSVVDTFCYANLVEVILWNERKLGRNRTPSGWRWRFSKNRKASKIVARNPQISNVKTAKINVYINGWETTWISKYSRHKSSGERGYRRKTDTTLLRCC